MPWLRPPGTPVVTRTHFLPASSVPAVSAVSQHGHGLKEIKLRTLPKLGRGKDELPFAKWKIATLAEFMSTGIEGVLEHDLPLLDDSQERFWYSQASSKIFAALLTAVKMTPLLADKLRL